MAFRLKLDKVLKVAIVIIMAIMVLNVLWQVISRYFFNEPSSFTDELSRYLMIWLGILGASYVSGQNKHVAIDFFPKKLSDVYQRRLKNFTKILIVVASISVFVIGGGRLVYVTFHLQQLSPALQLPLALVYLVLPLSGLIIVYYKLHDLLAPPKGIIPQDLP